MKKRQNIHITNIDYQEFDPEKFYYVTYPGVVPYLYAININGTIISLKKNRERVMKYDFDKRLYMRITLRSIQDDTVKSKHYLISRLVAWEFVGQPENFRELQVNHADGDHFNNNYKNLEWVTGYENNIHKIISGLAASSEKHGWNSHKEIVVLDVIELINKGFDAPYIAKYILCKYKNLYSNMDKKDYDRLRGLVSKINNGTSWYHLSGKSEGSTTIENIPFEKHIGEEVSRVGLHPIEVCIPKW